MATEPVLSTPAAKVALIELNRPESANRLEPVDLAVLQRRINECEQACDVRVLVLAGRGSYFSAGFDLRALAAGLSSDIRSRADTNAFEATANRLENSRLVTIAALDGPVLGGATDLALACDFRLGARDVFMQMPAAKLGLPLYAGALQRYVNRMGLDNAKRLVLMAERIGATEMLEMGYLTELVEPKQALAKAVAKAEHLAAMPARSMGVMKLVLNAAALCQGTEPKQRILLAKALDPEEVLRNLAGRRAARHQA